MGGTETTDPRLEYFVGEHPSGASTLIAHLLSAGVRPVRFTVSVSP